jgi:hypothetical protein
MNRMRHRTWLSAGAVALGLVGAPLIAAAQSTPNAADQAVGTTYTKPEWQRYAGMHNPYGPLAWLTFDQMIGSRVTNKQGTTVGTVVGLLRDRSNNDFYALLDTVGDGRGDQIVPVDHMKVVGNDPQRPEIVLAGGGTSDFNQSDFNQVAPGDRGAQG